MLTVDLIDALLFILPAYIANSTPVVFGGGTPLDFNKKMKDGRRIFGKGKTIRGAVAGVVCGTLVVFLELPFVSSYPLVSQTSILIAFLLSLGAISGDLVGSFLKRRLGVKSGAHLPFADQLGFVIFALLFVSLVIKIPLAYIAFLVIVTPFVHWLFNVLAYLLKLKSVPY